MVCLMVSCVLYLFSVVLFEVRCDFGFKMILLRLWVVIDGVRCKTYVVSLELFLEFWVLERWCVPDSCVLCCGCCSFGAGDSQLGFGFSYRLDIWLRLIV